MAKYSYSICKHCPYNILLFIWNASLETVLAPPLPPQAMRAGCCIQQTQPYTCVWSLRLKLYIDSSYSDLSNRNIDREFPFYIRKWNQIHFLTKIWIEKTCVDECETKTHHTVQSNYKRNDLWVRRRVCDRAITHLPPAEVYVNKANLGRPAVSSHSSWQSELP